MYFYEIHKYLNMYFNEIIVICNDMHVYITRKDSFNLYYIHVIHSVMQCVAVCCSMLQCAAVGCSGLRCVAVRCGVL